MKGRYLVLCVVLFSSEVVAQEKRWLAGGGATYCSYVDNPGINLSLTYRLIGNFHIGPDFSAVLTKESRENGRIFKRKELEYNLNAQQLFELTQRFSFYPFAGLNISKVNNHAIDEPPDKRIIAAINLGGGLEWQMERCRFFAESKYVSWFRKYDITAGVLFEF